nr:helix-turn-helix domain-containing protein [Ruegeria profundi]
MSGADLLISNAEARLIAVLLRFAGLRGPTTNNTVLVPVTQQELASATNLSRNWTGRILRKLAGTDGSKPDTTDYSFVIQLNCAVF